jgi:hypothetical protein
MRLRRTLKTKTMDFLVLNSMERKKRIAKNLTLVQTPNRTRRRKKVHFWNRKSNSMKNNRFSLVKIRKNKINRKINESLGIMSQKTTKIRSVSKENL